MYPRQTRQYEDIRPVGWFYLPGQNLPVYLREALPTGGYMFGRDRTGPGLVGHSGQGIVPMPAWFPAGDAAEHVSQLVMMMVFAAEQPGTAGQPGAADQFVGWVRTSKINAVTAIYQGGMYHYPTLAAFAQACSNHFNDQAYDADTSKSLGTILDERELRRELQSLVTLPVAFPPLQLVVHDQFVPRTANFAEVGAAGQLEQYDTPWCMVDDGLWTDHMGPCITVGLTGMAAGKRYNSLLHSFSDSTGKQILDAFGRAFGRDGLPALNTLTNVAWFVVGGSPEWSSLDKAVSLATELRSRNLPLIGVQFTTDPEYMGRAKAVAIDAAGQVFWTYY